MPSGSPRVVPGAPLVPTPSYLSGSSVTMTMRRAPSARMLWAIWITEWPSGVSPTRWPPVMATASLYKIL